MRAALLGWLFFFLALIGGYMIGRHRRLTSRPGTEGTAAPSGTGSLGSTVPIASAGDLPSDYRRSESVPQTLK